MKKKSLLNTLILMSVILFLFGSGCTQFRKRDYNKKIARLAVLPFENFSNDVKGAEVSRKKVYEALLKGGYEVLDLEKTDALLRDVGVTDGGQLRAVDLAKVAEVLGTKTFVTGEVKIYFQGMSFEVLPLGLFFKREVKLKITVLEALTEKKLFEKERSGRNLERVEDDKKSSFLENLADSAIKNAVSDTIYSGAELMAWNIAKELVYIMPYYYEN
ncbi:MAG: GNA1162 family protein [Candidatus Firestonebacteria bacterium]